jgi:hypothetical protein
MKFRIDNIGLFHVAKEPLQEHKAHPTYSNVQRLRIDSIGLLHAAKEPAQAHKTHPTYSWLHSLRIDSLGLFSTSASGSRPAKSRNVRVNKLYS